MATGLVDTMLANCFRPLRDAVQEASAAPVTSVTAREMLSAAEVMMGALEGLWNALRESMSDGIEGRQLVANLKEAEGRIAECLRTYSAVPARLNGTHGPANPIATLDKLTARTEKLRDEVAGLLKWLDVPLPPDLIEKVRRMHEASTPADYVNLDELMKQWQQDGDL